MTNAVPTAEFSMRVSIERWQPLSNPWKPDEGDDGRRVTGDRQDGVHTRIASPVGSERVNVASRGRSGFDPLSEHKETDCDRLLEPSVNECCDYDQRDDRREEAKSGHDIVS